MKLSQTSVLIPSNARDLLIGILKNATGSGAERARSLAALGMRR